MLQFLCGAFFGGIVATVAISFVYAANSEDFGDYMNEEDDTDDDGDEGIS